MKNILGDFGSFICTIRAGTYDLAFAVAIGFSLISMCSMWFAAPRQVRAVAGRIAVPKPQRP